MCWNTKNQCRYCKTVEHLETDFCHKAKKTGKVCMSENFQTKGPLISKTPNGAFFNADTHCNSKFKASTCNDCHQIELQVLEMLPGRQSLYEYNSDNPDSNQQHLNDAVFDGTMQVTNIGWEAWRDKLRYYTTFENSKRPVSPTGLTDPDEPTTPPSSPPSPDTASDSIARRRLLREQAEIRAKLDARNEALTGRRRPLSVSEAMVQHGSEFPILRIRTETAPIAQVRRALEQQEADADLYGDISSTMQNDLQAVMDRHAEWTAWQKNKNSSPPRPHKNFVAIDQKYRNMFGIPVVNFN